MNDKWTDNKMVSSAGWVQVYSGKTQKAWSFGLSGFVLFGIVFFWDSYSTVVHLIAVVLFASTAVNLFINESLVKEQTQALAVISGYVGSIGLLIYANM